MIGEIWATADHAVEGHAHEADEMLYVLSGAIEVNGRTLRANEVVHIPGGSAYTARVASPEGAHVLRVEFPRATACAAAGEASHQQDAPPEYDARPWTGPLTKGGFPDLGEVNE